MTILPKVVVFDLSAIDQAMMRIHIRYCLCFPCENSSAARDAITARLKTAVSHAVTKMPILAGTVSAVGSNPGLQEGQLEVRLTLDQLNAFEPIVKVLNQQEFPYTYEDLRASEMPPVWLMGNALTPLPDNPSINGGGPAFAVQGSFIQGGFLVAIFMHHSVADLQGVTEVIKHMSNANTAPSPGQPTQQELHLIASKQSRTRDALVGLPAFFPYRSEPIPEPPQRVSNKAIEDGTNRIFAFDLEKIMNTKDMINKSSKEAIASEKPVTPLSAFNCLAAILWKGINRACVPDSVGEDISSIVLVPTSFRKTLEPSLDDSYYGNGCLPAITAFPTKKLKSSYDESSIKETAEAIRENLKSMNDQQVRGSIAAINSQPDVRMLSNPEVNLKDGNIVVSSWEGLPSGEEASLALGLGAPQFTRVVSREFSKYFCIVLPRKRETGVWEVQVELPSDDMRKLLLDDDMMQFVKWVSK